MVAAYKLKFPSDRGKLELTNPIPAYGKTIIILAVKTAYGKEGIILSHLSSRGGRHRCS
jgi:hypothetical protein